MLTYGLVLCLNKTRIVIYNSIGPPLIHIFLKLKNTSNKKHFVLSSFTKDVLVSALCYLYMYSIK